MWSTPFLIENEETPLDTLRRWYYMVTPEQERVGDVALHPFDENVVAIPVVKGYVGPLGVPMAEMNPYASSFFLFYSYTKTEIYVLGGLGWNKMFEMGGNIVFSPPGGGGENTHTPLLRNRCFPLLYEPPSLTRERSPSKDINWWLPLDIPRTPGYVNQVNATMDDIMFRLQWMLGRRQYTPGREDSVSPLALGIFECTIKDAEKRIAFHNLRMAKEKTCFEEHLATCVGEQDFLDLFEHNGLKEYMDEAMIKKPTNQDLFAFWRRTHSSKGNEPPSIIVRVPLEECPPSLVTLPIYSYGLVHLTYKELPLWLWNLFVTQAQKLAVRKCDYYAEEDRWLEPLHDMFDNVTIQEMETATRLAERHRHKNDQVYASAFSTSERKEVDWVTLDVDIEDIAEVAPPCVAQCISAQRFPSHEQRKRLLPILQTSGLTQERVFAWFERKNNAFPKNGVAYKDAKARFDYVGLWKAKLGPTFCGNIAKSMHGGSEFLQCPYGGNKGMCAPEERTNFAGPHDLIQRRAKLKIAQTTK